MKKELWERLLGVLGNLASLFTAIAFIWQKRVLLRRMVREGFRKLARMVRYAVQSLPTQSRLLISRVAVLVFSLVSAWFVVLALIAVADASLKPELHLWQRLAGFLLASVVLGPLAFLYRREARKELERIRRPLRRRKR